MLLRGTHQAWSNKNSYIVYSLIDLDITYRLGSISISFDTKICTVLFIPGREETNGNGKWSQSWFPTRNSKETGVTNCVLNAQESQPGGKITVCVPH